MKKLLLTLFILLIPFTTLPQFNNPENEKKVDPLILKELRIINTEIDNGKTLNKELAKSKKIKWTRVDDNGRILVSISYTNRSIKNKLLNLGCEIKTEGSEQLYVWIPYEKIEDVVELEEVIKIRSLGIAKTRSVTGEGFLLHKGNLAQTSYNAYGQSIKVGVISDGIAEWQASYQNGDLPQSITILDPGTTDGTEGTAMMEIVYDFAPQSNYYFAGVELGTDGPVDMANNILNLSANGCKVIVDDIGWPGGYSYFQEKEISWAINSFVSPPNNGCYISAAGNDADIMYSGNNYSWLYNQQDNKYYLYWDLSMTDKFNDINLVDLESMIIFFQWADDWNNPIQEFKMIWCDAFGNTLEESEGTSPQQILEFDEESPYLNGNYKLKIQSDDPASVVELKIIFDYTKNSNNQNSNANIEYLTTSKHIFGHPIVDNVISVAAVNYNENEVEFFSSRGPAIISNGLVTVENEQPKITGADGVSTFVWGAEGFSGTSAAAPHIAGIAAQYFSKFPNDSYSEFLFHLKSSAIPLEDGNPNHWSIKSGHGIGDSYEAIHHKYGSSAVYIRQLDKNDIIFGEAAWYNWTVNPEHWQNYGPFEPVIGASTIHERFRALQDFKENTYEKYHHWNKNNSPTGNVQNHANISTTNQNELLTAKFNEVVNASVQISLDGAFQNTGIIKFKDPWYFEQSSQYWQYPYGYRNMGMSQIPEEETSPLNLYTSSTYKGVFLDQLVPDGTYYSAEVAQTQTLSGKQSYFVNWSATGQTGVQGIISSNSLNTPIVFKEEGDVVSANYHSAQQSNFSNAYSNPGQRKFIKTTNQQYGNNYFHKVYESHGKVWYEMSSDGGNTWQIMNNGQPLNTGGGSAKYPSIDYNPDYYYPNQVIIVFLEERLEPIHEYYIMAQFYDNGIFQYESIVASNEEDYYVGEFSKPVVARRFPTFLVAWDDSPLLGSRGLMYRLGQLGAQIYWNTDALPVEYGLGNEYRNPSIAISKSGTGLGTYRLAFDKGSNIMGVNLEVCETGTYPPYSVRENGGYAFGQAGFSQNYQPSISVMPNNDFRISWFGYNSLAADDGLKGSQPLYEKKVVTWFNYQFYVFGTNVSSHSMSVTDDGISNVPGWITNFILSLFCFRDNFFSPSFEFITGSCFRLR
ncbi:MAG: S8 family serine peptidase [Ignavibacteriaceae bacterium]|nr:S8 family serine peptidase [Ignavibacteriaceae bacterium]